MFRKLALVAVASLSIASLSAPAFALVLTSVVVAAAFIWAAEFGVAISVVTSMVEAFFRGGVDVVDTLATVLFGPTSDRAAFTSAIDCP